MTKHLAIWMFLAFGLPFTSIGAALSIGAQWFGLTCVAINFYVWKYGDKVLGDGNVERMEREEMMKQIMLRLKTRHPRSCISEARDILARMEPCRVG